MIAVLDIFIGLQHSLLWRVYGAVDLMAIAGLVILNVIAWWPAPAARRRSV